MSISSFSFISVTFPILFETPEDAQC